jgi:hypothetical protein
MLRAADADADSQEAVVAHNAAEWLVEEEEDSRVDIK